MKIRFASLVLLALIFMPALSSAQLDERKPGIYAVVRDTSVALPFTRSTVMSAGTDFVEVAQVYYKGATSGVTTNTRTFVLVTDPKKKTFTVQYPFVRNLTPVNMRFLPLLSDVNRDRREYEAGVRVGAGFLYEEKFGLEFDWEQITDNSFLITIPENLEPGEYGFSFCLHRIGTYDYFYHIFGFTIPE